MKKEETFFLLQRFILSNYSREGSKFINFRAERSFRAETSYYFRAESSFLGPNSLYEPKRHDSPF